MRGRLRLLWMVRCARFILRVDFVDGARRMFVPRLEPRVTTRTSGVLANSGQMPDRTTPIRRWQMSARACAAGFLQGPRFRALISIPLRTRDALSGTPSRAVSAETAQVATYVWINYPTTRFHRADNTNARNQRSTSPCGFLYMYMYAGGIEC